MGADGFTDPTVANTWTADQTFNDNVNATFGTSGNADIDYDGSHLVIKADVAGSGNIRIETAIAGTDSVNGGNLNIENSTGDAVGPTLTMYHNSSTPADNDVPARINILGKDSGGTQRLLFQINPQFDDVTSTTMDTTLFISLMNNVNAGDANTTASLSSVGVWTDAASFAELKQPERQLTTASVLRKLRSLDVYRFRTIGRPDNIDEERHISPTADDFYLAFKAGKDPRVNNDEGKPQYGIAARDLAGVALMAIQELIKENDKLKERLDALEVQ